MSSDGTSADYCTGYDDAADETKELYAPLLKAAEALLAKWGNGNLSGVVQALAKAVKAIPEGGRVDLDETTYPPGYRRPDEED